MKRAPFLWKTELPLSELAENDTRNLFNLATRQKSSTSLLKRGSNLNVCPFDFLPLRYYLRER